MSTSGTQRPRITDVNVFAGGLCAEIADACVPGAPARKSCIATLNSVDFAWLGEPLAARGFRVADDGHAVEWAALQRSISAEEILDHSTVYFLRWMPDRRRNDVDVSEIIGCWKTLSGYILLDPSGMVRIKLVAKGTAGDAGGDWRWERLADNRLVITRRDVDATDEPTWRQELLVSRFDGQIVELGCWSGFNLAPEGFPEIRLWKKSKPPKSWERSA